MPRLDVRLRVPSAGLLALPWRAPLAEWDATMVPLRDIPVGPSRHLVKFVETDGRLWALKELPHDIAVHEYDMLRQIETLQLNAVRPAGIVVQPFEDTAILVTQYLEASWQYRRLFMRVPTSMTQHRKRLLRGMAALLVELHRSGIYWGDCSLANTLFMRDGQAIQAWMVDGETAEIHDELSTGQRNLDLDIMVENVLGGLLDVSARLEEPEEMVDQIVAEAEGVVVRYEFLWNLVHEQPVIPLEDPGQVTSHLRRLNEMGFAVDELRLESAGDGDNARLSVDLAGRRFHADRLRALTGIAVGEGQGRILLNDLHAHQARLQAAEPGIDEHVAARRWVADVLTPGIERAHHAVGFKGSPTQAYCDLLEVRWLLSEQKGVDVGDEPALEALAERMTPPGSAANLSILDLPTQELPVTRRHEFPPPTTPAFDGPAPTPS